MSRFADPTAVESVSLGACQCPGTPHEEDKAGIRWQLGGSAWARLKAVTESDPGFDTFAAYRQVVLETVVWWTLLVEVDGRVLPVPINAATIEELDAETLTTLATAADELIASKGRLPNASGAPSRASSRGSASHTPTAKSKPGT